MRIKVFVPVTLALLLYVIIGGVIFKYLEDTAADANTKPDFQTEITLDQETCQRAKNFSEVIYRILDEAFTAVVSSDHRYSLNVIKKLVDKDNCKLEIVFKFNRKRVLYDWVFYAETIVTTIGYGHIAPVSEVGRVTSCFFAIFGVPLMALWVKGISEHISQVADVCRKKVSVKEEPSRNILVIQICTVAILGSFFFVIIPSEFFSFIEDWPFSDALYYVIMTLSTIGIGDMVAGTGHHHAGWYRAVIHIWFLIGIGWLTMIISLFVEMYRSRTLRVMRKASSKLKKIKSEILENAYQSKFRKQYNSFSGRRGVEVILRKTVTLDSLADLWEPFPDGCSNSNLEGGSLGSSVPDGICIVAKRSSPSPSTRKRGFSFTSFPRRKPQERHFSEILNRDVVLPLIHKSKIATTYNSRKSSLSRDQTNPDNRLILGASGKLLQGGKLSSLSVLEQDEHKNLFPQTDSTLKSSNADISINTFNRIFSNEFNSSNAAIDNSFTVITEHGIAETIENKCTILRPRSKSK